MRGGAFIFALCAAKHPRPLKKRRPEISPVGRRVSTGFHAFCAHSLSAICLRSLQNSVRASRRANEIAERRLRAAAKTQSAGKSRSTGRSARPLRRAAIQSAFLPARSARAARKISSASQGKRLEDAAALRSRLYLFQSPRIMALRPGKARFPRWQARLPGGAAPPGIRGDAPVCPPESGLPVRAR